MLVRKDPEAPRFKPYCHKTWQLSGGKNPSQASTTLSDSSSNHQKTYSPSARDRYKTYFFWIFLKIAAPEFALLLAMKKVS
jgi:hypothetical protein